jgi:hypothetical protein
MMRKPRDYDAELKALDDKARQLRQRRIVQLGELVIACGADGLSPEQLAGALLGLKDMNANTAEGWRQRGAAFFQRTPRKPARGNDRVPGGMLPLGGGTPSS